MGNERDILLGHILTQIEKLNEKHDDMAKQNIEAHIEQQRELTYYNSLLAEHMRRTENVENRTTAIEVAIQPVVAKYQAESTVRRFFNTKLIRIGKVIGIIGATAGAIWGIIQIINYLNTL